MLQDPLQDRLESGKPALGMWVNTPEMIDLAANLDLDWAMIDQMFTGIGWNKAEELMRASEAAGITPVARVQSNPWLGYDHRVPVDVTRNLGIGYKYVLVSHSGKGEIEECLEVADDWHRKAITVHPFNSLDEWEERREELSEGTYVIPHPETVDALEGLEETLQHPKVKLLFIPMTDAGLQLAGSETPDWDNPDLWEYVDRAVELGEETDTIIGANTSYAYTMDAMEQRVVDLHEHGVQMIMMQGAPFLFQVAMNEFLGSVKERIDY